MFLQKVFRMAIIAAILSSTSFAGGSILAWGAEHMGNLDIPDPNEDFLSMGAGGSHFLAIRSDSTVVGNGDNRLCSTRVPYLLNQDFVLIDGGNRTVIAMNSSGEAIAWGSNFYGACDIVCPDSIYLDVSIGRGFALAVKVDG